MIELAIRKPVSVAVGVLLILLFGGISLSRIPVQLTPEIIKPQITIETIWPGASPHEIEREIVEEQEDQLKGVEGVERITSESSNGLGRIILEFPAGTNLDTALVRVSNRLEQVPEYPEEADKPVIRTSNLTDNAMAWFMLYRKKGNTDSIDNYFRLCDDKIRPEFEKINGVGASNVFGGREEEVQVIVRPAELAERRITISQLMRALDRENANWRGGEFDEGKRKYIVRTVGEYVDPDQIYDVVIASTPEGRVYVRDVAEVRIGLKKKVSFVRQKGVPTIAINCVAKPGSNVLETMKRIREVTERLNAGFLNERQLGLTQVYDETTYIHDSIDRVVKNLLIGSALAIIVLFLFLRSGASTLVIALAIPISVVGSFILMTVFGRSLNVISLAGMSFAAGMVVDNAIVSLENIYRLRQQGLSAFEAALQGARQVWGAILASTLTTIAVFLPIFFVEEQAAQLFKDIALAISCSVGLSLIVSITVIPAMSARLLKGAKFDGEPKVSWVGKFFGSIRDAIANTVGWVNRSVILKIVIILGLTSSAFGLSWYFLPEAEYLPEGNRNLAFGVLLPPPGYTLTEIESMGKKVESQLGHLFSDYGGETTTESGDEKVIEHFFFVGAGTRVFLGAAAVKPEDAGQLVPHLKSGLGDIPGMISIIQQSSLFERGVSTGRRIDIEISGPDLERLIGLGGQVFGQVMAMFPFAEGHQSRPIPSLDLEAPEVHITPDRELARDLGLDASEIGLTVDAVVDGARASEYMHKGLEIDLTVMGGEPGKTWHTQDLKRIPIYTPEGRIVPLDSVAQVTVTRGPEQINHVERDRVITIQVVPSTKVSLEKAVERLQEEVVKPLQASGQLGVDYRIELAGTADDLDRAFDAFKWNFLLAIIITYLLLAALFESFFYPFVILFSVPLAAVGGILCLRGVQEFFSGVQLDVLTLLGFVILVGVVVNNAILIVYQALQGVREGLLVHDSIVESVRGRIRPIFMTTMTSTFGMLPLVLFPGSGSELYRGLGAVVLGGLLVSTVFTLLLIPALLSILLSIWKPAARSTS